MKGGISWRSLHVAVLRERHVISDTKLSIKSTHLPVTIRNRLAMAHRCPYRNNEIDLELVDNEYADPSVKSVVLGNSSSLFNSSSIVSSSRLLKSRSIPYGSSVFEKSKLQIRRQQDTPEKDYWIPKEDIFVAEDGTKFLHSATYGRYLNLIFGIGGWCLYPFEDTQIDDLSDGFFVSRKFGFVSHGQLLSDTQTEFILNQRSAKYGVETIRSKAVSVFAQKLGLGINSREI